jgi:hypothetical protein
MAIVTPTRPARLRRPALSPPPVRRRARGWVPATATIVGVAVALQVAYAPRFMNYDARYALLWARDALRGVKPDYSAAWAPTPHPLETVISALALPFGDSADVLLTWLVLLCFGALVWLTFRVGEQLFSPWVGAVAAAVIATRPAIERDALLAYQDVAFAALVLGAVLLEARRPRRGVPVLGLLAVAGLLRPEAWVLSLAYAAYLWRFQAPRERAVLLALAVAAPALWALSDWLVTGDPLHSLHGTAALAAQNDRRRDIDQVPYWTAKYFGYALREPLVVGVPLGMAFAWRHARRATALPLVVAALMTAIFALGPLFGLPLIRRYIETPAALLALFYGLAVCGWLLLPRGGERRMWRALGVLAALLSVAFLPLHFNLLASVKQRFVTDSEMYSDLRAAAGAPAVRTAFASCAPLSAGDHRPVPYMRYWLGGDPGSVNTVERHTGRLGRMLLLPQHSPSTRRVYTSNTFPGTKPPRGWAQIYANRSWRVYAAPGCA